MLGAIAGIVVVLGIGFLIAYALDASWSDATRPARKDSGLTLAEDGTSLHAFHIIGAF
jgi:hypothetical protein